MVEVSTRPGGEELGMGFVFSVICSFTGIHGDSISMVGWPQRLLRECLHILLPAPSDVISLYLFWVTRGNSGVMCWVQEVWGDSWI